MRNLNCLVKGKYAYDEASFKGVTLRGQTKELQNPEYKGVRLYTFHRLLLEDAFPDLRRVAFTNSNFSFSSFRKHLVSFLRSIGLRDVVIARILGQEALDSQNAYDRVGEYEHGHGCDLAEGHVDAMIEGREEFYPSIPFDLYIKIVECFDVQAKALECLQAFLLAEMRALHQQSENSADRRQQEAEKNAERRLQEELEAVQRVAEELRAIRNDLKTREEHYEHQIFAMEQRHCQEMASCQRAIVRLQQGTNGDGFLEVR
jgi:hypothetical protein